MIRGADLSHADICEISTELEAEENLDPQPPGHVHHHRRGRLRRQLSEAHRHPSPTVLSHQRDWPGRDVGAEQCRGTVRPACGTCAALLQSLGRPGCSGCRNCNVNLDELRGDRPDLDCEPQQAGGIPRNLQLDETGTAAAGAARPVRTSIAAVGSGTAISRSRVAVSAFSDGCTPPTASAVSSRCTVASNNGLHQRDLGHHRRSRAADNRIADHCFLGHRCGAQDFGTLA
jgi:hypothetical protein